MAPGWRHTEFWCKRREPQGLPSGLSLGAEVYFAGLHFKLFGYMSEGKSLSQRSDTTSICSGTTRLGYWSPNISFPAETVQIPTARDGLSAGSCSAGSVFSENELHPCSVTGVAWWPLNQHLSPRSTEIRLQSGRTSAPTDDLLFYLEQRQPRRSAGTWLLELITHALWGEQEFRSLPLQQPGTLLRAWIISGWSFLFLFISPGLKLLIQSLHLSSTRDEGFSLEPIEPNPFPIAGPHYPPPWATCHVFHPSGIFPLNPELLIPKSCLLASFTTIIHPWWCMGSNPRKRWEEAAPPLPLSPSKPIGKAWGYNQIREGNIHFFHALRLLNICLFSPALLYLARTPCRDWSVG